MEQQNEMEPYQPFFLSGILISVLGVGLWGLFEMGWLRFYPLDSHAMLMVSGFLLAYVSGFLMTAVPKMSSTFSASTAEISLGVMLLWMQVIVCIRNSLLLSSVVGLLQLSILVVFVTRRLAQRKSNPPPSFVFLPFSFLAAFVGFGILLALALDITLSGELIILGRLLLFQGFILNLILGLGSRLIPALCRIPGSVGVRGTSPESKTVYVLIALLLISSFFIEAFYSVSAGNGLKFLIVSGMALWRFKIFKKIPDKGYLAIGLRLGVVLLASGFLLASIFPTLAIHFIHLSYIGGFSLITILISTRVVLAHGGYSLELELKSRELAWFYSIVAILAVMRVVMGIQVAWRGALVAMLVIGWIFACGIWAKVFLKKLIHAETRTE